MEQAGQQLLMAAAQQLTEEYTARLGQARPGWERVAAESAQARPPGLSSGRLPPNDGCPSPPLSPQAEGRARQLEQQLHGMAAAVERLQRESAEHAAAATAAREEAGQERQAAQALLETNLRLHETVAQLMEGVGSGRGGSNSWARAAAGPAEGALAMQEVGQAQHGWREQRRGLNSSQPPAAKPAPRAAACHERGTAKAAGAEGRQRGQRSRQLTPAALPPPAPPVATAPAEAARLLARRPTQLARPPLRSQHQQALPAVDAAAREAAVQAVLALSAEHRELLSCYQAVAAELKQVAGTLAAGGQQAGRQLALLRQHAALQAERRDLGEQLGDKVAQLAALKRAGVL